MGAVNPSTLDWMNVWLRVIGDPEGDHVIIGLPENGDPVVVAINIKG
jgi:hypothetical protein